LIYIEFSTWQTTPDHKEVVMSDVSISIALERFTTFGDLLKYLRRRTGVTQRELSIAVGYSDAQISRLEQNERLPDLATLTARFLPVLMLEDHPDVAERLLELAANMRREDAPASGLPPYKGLYFFDETDADMFFGREELTASLVNRLTSGLEVDHRFLAVIGASGSGKSSVVRAGLIPTLRWEKTSSGWPIDIITPTAKPLEALANAFDTSSSLHTSVQEMATNFTNNADSFDQVLEDITEMAGAAHAFLVVDQFEELFTLCRSEAEQTSFIENLLRAAFKPHGTAIILVTMRADFYAHCARFDSLRQALAHHQEYIGPMSTGELRKAIEEPARHGHWEIEPGLVELLLQEIGADTGSTPEPGALPLLSHALLETWQHRRGRTLTLSGYTASGGVRGAIAETAEAVFHDQLGLEQRTIARQIFLRLTELGGDAATADTRRRVSFDELVSRPEEREAIHQVLLTLADARLITTEQDSVEVAHEALIREWPTLRTWLEEDRESLRLHRHLTEAAQEWENTDRDSSGLYRGARLAQAIEWSNEHVEEMNLLERAFVEASHALAEKEIREREEQRQRELEAAKKVAEEQARSAKLQRSRALWLTGISLVTIFLAVLAFVSRSSAQREAAINRSLVLAGLAIEAQEAGEVDRALALVLEAVSMNNPPPETVSKLSTIASGMGTRTMLIGHNGAVGAGEFSPDGDQVISGGCMQPDTNGNCSTGELILWDLSTQKEIARWLGHDDWITALAWRPDEQEILSGGSDGRLILWEAATQKLLDQWDAHENSINAIAISPDGKLAATAGADGVITILDLSKGEITYRLNDHEDSVLDTAISFDGQHLLSGSTDATMILWNFSAGTPIRTYHEHTSNVNGVAFLPDGQQILSASSDYTFRVWDISTGEELQKREWGDTLDNMVITPDGQTVLHCSGHVIYTWDLEVLNAVHQKLLGHSKQILDMKVSADSRLALSASADGTIRVWNLRSTDDVQQTDIGFPATGMAVSPDGKRLAIAGWTNESQIWDISKKEAIHNLKGSIGIGAPGGVAYSMNGKWVAISSGEYDQDSENAKLIVWDAMTGDLHCDLQGHVRRVRTVAFSPDNRYVLSGSQGVDDSGDLILWDVKDCSLVQRFDTRQDTTGIDFSNDGRYAFTSSAFSENATLWDVETGQAVHVYLIPGEVLLDAAFGPADKTVIAAALSGMIVQWDRETGAEINRFVGHDGGVWSVTVSPDEQFMVSSDDTGIIILWDLATGKELRRHTVHNALSFQAAFSPDGQTVYSVSADETLIVWRIGDPTLDTLLSWIKDNRYMRELTCEEITLYQVETKCD
jgi:WD40 repeat protein/transcriptional regulator with XRE-family HTH domain